MVSLLVGVPPDGLYIARLSTHASYRCLYDNSPADVLLWNKLINNFISYHTFFQIYTIGLKHTKNVEGNNRSGCCQAIK